jgi:polyhydroxybutyrate depolymerase
VVFWRRFQSGSGGKAKNYSEVVVVTIRGSGHTWPGLEPGVDFLGKSTKNISANDLMWEFFQSHPMPENLSC